MSANDTNYTAPDERRVSPDDTERYRAFIENSTEGIWRFETEQPISIHLSEEEQIDAYYRLGYLAEANNTFARMYGFTQGEELVGTRLGDFLVRDDPKNIAYLRAFIRSGYRLEDAESVETDSAGYRKHFSNTLTGIVLNDNLVRAWGTQRDITDRVKAEAAQEAALRQRESILESIGEMFYALDADFQFTYINHHAETVWERERAGLLGRRIGDEFPQILGTDFYQAQAQAMQERRTIIFETISPIRGRWTEGSVYPAEDGGISVYFRDIHEQKESESRLRQSEERFRALADNIAQLAWMADGSGSIFWYNRRWYDYTGTTLDEMKGWGWQKIHHPDYVENVTQKFRNHVLAGLPWEDTFPLRSRRGEYRWFLSRAFPIRDQTGSVFLWCGTNTDVTERFDMEARQRRFLREMLFGFTEGRLRLCDTDADLPAPLPPLSDSLELSAPVLRLLRKRVEAVAEGLRLPKERFEDMITAVHEAAMNAVRHGGGGTARIHGEKDSGTIQVWVEDHGPGIGEELIHRAVEQGFTTGGFGQGFFLMRSCADRVYLKTGQGGTLIVLEMERQMPEPAWLQSAKSLP